MPTFDRLQTCNLFWTTSRVEVEGEANSSRVSKPPQVAEAKSQKNKPREARPRGEKIPPGSQSQTHVSNVSSTLRGDKRRAKDRKQVEEDRAITLRPSGDSCRVLLSRVRDLVVESDELENLLEDVEILPLIYSSPTTAECRKNYHFSLFVFLLRRPTSRNDK